MKLKNILNPASLSGTGFFSVFIAILIIVPTIGGFWIYSEYKQKQKELTNIQNRYMDFHKKKLSNDIQNVVNFINYKKSNTENRVRKIVKERIHHAYSLASHIYSMDKFTKTNDEIKSKIIETLRPIRWNNGRGYFFILNYNGIAVLNADNPFMENKDNLYLKDVDGKLLIRDMIRLGKDNDSGFYKYKWNKPGEKGASHLKITYVKNFIPFEWVICAGFYVQDMEENIKQEILDRISQVTDHKDHYIFVLQQDGFCLSHPIEKFHHKNIIDHRSPDGQEVIKELVDIGKRYDDGGYIKYLWERPTTGKVTTKLSFAVGVKDWEWTIGTGVYLDDMEETIALEKNIFKNELKKNVLIIISITVLVTISSLVLGFIITQRLESGVKAFTDFFKKAADEDIKIDQKHLIFSEFKTLGFLANQMVEDRIQKEKALKKFILEISNLQNLLKNITDSMPSYLITVDREMRILQWNKKSETATGVSADEAIEKTITNVYPLADQELNLIAETLEKGTPATLTRVEKDDGESKRYEDITVYPLLSEDIHGKMAQIKGAVIRIDDTTDKVRIEEMMIQSEKMLSIGGLAAGMAHEINNPLSGIIGNTDVLKNRLTNDLPVNIKAAKEVGLEFENIKAYSDKRGLPLILENIRQAGSRAATIVADMLSFSRMGASDFSLCDLTELLEKTVDLAATNYDLKKKFDFRGITIKRFYDKDMPQVRCESSKLQQVFLNILSNGAHALAEIKDDRPPEFKLSIFREKDFATIEIEDNGPGMPENIRKRIFEPFFTTKEVGIGTGLGLSVSYFIVTEQHKGVMSVESHTGQGTKFTIKLPIGQPA